MFLKCRWLLALILAVLLTMDPVDGQKRNGEIFSVFLPEMGMNYTCCAVLLF